jgi:hypothetical protein
MAGLRTYVQEILMLSFPSISPSHHHLFAHISAALGGFMFSKRANRGAMRS